MELSNNIKKRFIKDYSLPISVLSEPLFSYYIEELDELYGTKEKLVNLVTLIEDLGNEDLFFKESSRVVDNVIEAISRKNIYKELQEDRLDNCSVIKDVNHKDIYNLKNVGEHFVSIDLVKANFNSMKSYSNELVLNSTSYEDLLSKFTDHDYYKNSKQIRQVIFGNLLPKKQQRLQKDIIYSIYNELIELGIDKDKFINASTDEIIIHTISKEEAKLIANKIFELKETGKLQNTRIELFKLNNIGDRKYFVKEHYNGNVEFKGIPAYHFMQSYKEYLGKELNGNDLRFNYEGQVAIFEKPLFNDKQELNNTIELE